MLHEPELLVLDEPTNGLDPRQIIELRGLLRTLAQDCAVLVTSHILAEMERIADRVAILLDGRLLPCSRSPAPARGALLRVRARADRADAVARGPCPACRYRGVEPGGAGGATSPAGGWIPRMPTPPSALAAGLCSAGIASVERLEAASDLEELFLRLTASEAAPLTAFLALVAKEVRALFVSPIAYAVIAVFLVLTGYTFAVTLFLTKQATWCTSSSRRRCSWSCWCRSLPCGSSPRNAAAARSSCC